MENTSHYSFFVNTSDQSRRKHIFINGIPGNELGEKVISVIHSFCNNTQWHWLYPDELEFVFDPTMDSKTGAQVSMSDIKIGVYRIRISPRCNNFNEAIVLHETIHIFQLWGSEAVRKRVAKRERLDAALGRLSEKTGKYSKRYYLIGLRKITKVLFDKLWLEGLAYFYEYVLFSDKKIEFFTSKTDKMLNSTYILARESALKFKILWESHMETYKQDNPLLISKSSNRLRDQAEVVARDIGLHMVSLCFVHSGEVRSLMDKTPEFVLKKYVAASKERRLSPVVSYTDGSGTLDYKNLLDELTNTFNQIGTESNIL
jgi:hypothetical protein